MRRETKGCTESKEKGSEGRIKRMNCWCRDVRKIDRGRIYLSPDGSVLGVHLWRNEISGRLSGRGRLGCPAAYTLTQHPACSGCSHTTCSAFNLPARSVCAFAPVCTEAEVYKQGSCLTPPLHQATRAASPAQLFLAISFTPSWLAPKRNLLRESATKSSLRHS